MRKRSTLKSLYAFPVNGWVKDMQINSRPLKSPFLRDIVLIQYLTDFM